MIELGKPKFDHLSKLFNKDKVSFWRKKSTGYIKTHML